MGGVIAAHLNNYKTMFNYNNVHRLPIDSWANFKFKNYRDLSDFESWAIRKAVSMIFDLDNDRFQWWWTDGTIEVRNRNNESFIFGLTDNGIFFYKHYLGEKQIGQYVVTMEI